MLLCLVHPFCKGIRVISNAGGINPLACAAALQEVAEKADIDLKIAVITGDDLMSEVWHFAFRLSRTVQVILYREKIDLNLFFASFCSIFIHRVNHRTV